MATESKTPVSINDYNGLSRGSKLLLCYALYYGLDEIQLMMRDPDYPELAKLGWFEEKPSMIHGVKKFEIPDKLFDDLEKISDEVLSVFSVSDLEKYKKSKRASYPWLW